MEFIPRSCLQNSTLSFCVCTRFRCLLSFSFPVLTSQTKQGFSSSTDYRSWLCLVKLITALILHSSFGLCLRCRPLVMSIFFCSLDHCDLYFDSIFICWLTFAYYILSRMSISKGKKKEVLFYHFRTSEFSVSLSHV